MKALSRELLINDQVTNTNWEKKDQVSRKIIAQKDEKPGLLTEWFPGMDKRCLKAVPFSSYLAWH